MLFHHLSDFPRTRTKIKERRSNSGITTKIDEKRLNTGITARINSHSANRPYLTELKLILGVTSQLK